MNENDTCGSAKLIAIACAVGFIGDFLLQVMTQNMGGETGWGLKEYFKQHGSAESMFLASGMMGLFYVLFIFVLKLPVTYTYLALFGVLLDYIFRVTRLFPSLDGYYKSLNYFWSAFCGAIPMVLPLFIFSILN